MSFEQESNMHAFYVRRYPALRNVLGSVENLFNDYSALQQQSCEIELRLGSMVNGKFQNGVSELFFTQAIEMFKTYTGWFQVTPIVQEVDYFFTSNSKILRYRVIDQKSDSCIFKNIILKTDLLITSDEESIINTKSNSSNRITTNGMRVQLSNEEKIIPENFSYIPDFVRIKQRRSFVYGNWRYDFSRVWRGKSFNEADRLFLNNSPPSSCEIEIEYIGNANDKNYRSSSTLLSVSLLLKALDFFPPAALLTLIF